MRLLFIPDCAQDIGFGHVSRAMVLAKAAKQFSHDASFLIQDYSKAKSFIESSGFKVKTFNSNSYRSPEKKGPLVNALARIDADIVITDHRYNSNKLLTSIKSLVPFLVSIHDFGMPLHAPDVLLNGQIHATENMYPKREKQLQLIGPKYSLLSESVFQLRGRLKIRKKCEKILISLGGADRKELLPHLIEVCKDLYKKLGITVIIGPSVKNGRKLAKMVHGHGNIKLKSFTLKGISEEMRNSDVIICSGITTVTEALFIGLPTIIVPQIHHQLKTGLYLKKKGCSLLVQNLKQKKPKSVSGKICSFIDDYMLRMKLSSNGMMLFADKKSAGQTIEQITTHYKKVVNRG